MTMTVHLARLLVLAVIFVNGWTDAPNAIATAVGSGALSFRRGVVMAAACNFAGAALACLCFPAVADTIGELVAFADPYASVAAPLGSAKATSSPMVSATAGKHRQASAAPAKLHAAATTTPRRNDSAPEPTAVAMALGASVQLLTKITASTSSRAR